MMRFLRCAAPALALAAVAQSAPAQEAARPQQPPGTIVEVAVKAGQFNTLVAAVSAAGLAETLSGGGPFTVFAPTDAAFAKLPPGTVEALLADREKLIAVLTYHVVPGNVAAADVIRAREIRANTVNGAALDVREKDGDVFAGSSKVVAADIRASNGVIHVIDQVLLPPAGDGR